ncbi:hypothetical protein GS905_06285 [Rhodococcus hoagii]|nr:hypothetical protein [Prescottella equi]
MGFAIDADPDAAMFTDADAAAHTGSVGFRRPRAPWPRTPQSPANPGVGQSSRDWRSGRSPLLNSHLAEEFAATPPRWPDRSTSVHCAARRSLTSGLLPTVEALQSYVWRRPRAAATARRAGSVGEDTTHRTLVVGFADMVGYTSLTRRIRVDELSALLEDFESQTTSIITQGGGWVIKNVGTK